MKKKYVPKYPLSWDESYQPKRVLGMMGSVRKEINKSFFKTYTPLCFLIAVLILVILGN